MSLHVMQIMSNGQTFIEGTDNSCFQPYNNRVTYSESRRQ